MGGCPAVSRRVAQRVINSLKGGQYVFAYYPDQHWLSDSDLLHCAAARRSVAAIEADPGSAGSRAASPTL